MKIGITGGTGFIGSYLYDFLKKNHSVLRTVRTGKFEGGFPCSDIGNPEELNDFFQHADVLIHLANENRPRDKPTSLTQDLEKNLVKTLKLFEAFFNARPDGHLIFFSTGGAIYAPKNRAEAFLETDPVGPTSHYANQKLSAENFLRSLALTHNFQSTILRVSNPYGVPLSTDRNQGIIGVATSCARLKKPFHLFGRGDLVRDYLHLQDLGSAVNAVINEKAVQPSSEIYNLGSGLGHTTDEVILLINRYSPLPLEIVHEPAFTKEVLWNVLNISKFKKSFHWAPQKSLEKGIQELFPKS